MYKPDYQMSAVSHLQYGAFGQGFKFNKPLFLLVLLSVMAIWIASAAAAHAAEPKRIMLFGDSLLAGYGLSEADGFANQLQAALAENGQDVTIINASVSGDTTAGGVSRLTWSLADNPDLVILALGGNDILRAINPASTRANMETMLQTFDREGIPVLVAGMVAPKSLGPAYVAAFDPIYPELADQYDAAYYPFLLDGVAGVPALNQNDGIHPNGKGVALMVERMLPVVLEALEQLSASTANSSG